MKKKNCVFYIFIVFLGFYTEGGYAQAAINTTGNPPDSKAMLDITSDTKGFLMPRMTTTQRINIAPSAPAQTGLLVYDTNTKSVWQFNGTAWAEVSQTTTGLIYYPSRNALVLNDATRTDAQVGLNSTALGSSTASGDNSTASGNYSTASGYSSMASGYSTASGSSSTAMGSSTASGAYSTALGSSTASGIGSLASGAGFPSPPSTASGICSTALGASTTSGDYSTALGRSTASGIGSTASGNYTVASGYASTALGGFSSVYHDGYISSVATGDFSTALSGSQANGYGSIAMGGTTSTSSYCTTIGGINNRIITTPQTNATDWNLTDPLFIVGNGNPNIWPSDGFNALTILKNGNMGMGSIIAPTFRIEIPNIAASDGQGRANAWTTYSDNRVKFNQKPLHYGLSQIMQMQVKQYDHYSSEFKNGALVLSNSKPTFGLIAQELYKIIPEMVYKPDDESKDLWAIDYDKFGPLLVKTVQEQQAQIEVLKQQNETLTQQITALNTLKADVEALKAALQTGMSKQGEVNVKTASTERK